MSMNIGVGVNKISNKPFRGIFGAAVFVIALGFVFFLIHGSYAKPTYSITNNTLTISGQFGVKIDLSGAHVTHELSQVPTTDRKTNGAAIGKIEKGYFEVSGSKTYLNVMDKNASDYILITDKNDSKYYVVCASSQETDNLYQKISKQTGSAK